MEYVLHGLDDASRVALQDPSFLHDVDRCGKYCKTLVTWFEFAYMGTVAASVPAAWILAVASVPFSAAWCEGAAGSSAGRAVDVLHRWAAGGTLQAAFGTLPDTLDDRSALALETWLAWFANDRDWFTGAARDKCFRDLCGRLRAHVNPVSAYALLRFEDRVGTMLAPDIRRLLLEVGDVGEALFALKLLDGSQVIPGKWAWKESADGVDLDQPLTWVRARLHTRLRARLRTRLRARSEWLLFFFLLHRATMTWYRGAQTPCRAVTCWAPGAVATRRRW